MANDGGVGRGPRLTRRTYRQRDPVAAALDVLGDRWTLLIVRELVLGPRRWTDLLANLGGIGKNLLAERLRDLERAGLVTSVLLPWASSRTRLYRLSDSGAQLERLVLELARFGAPLVPADGEVRPDWAAFALAAKADPDVRQVLHARLDGADFTIRSGGGRVTVRRGVDGEATAVVEGTAVAVLADRGGGCGSDGRRHTSADGSEQARELRPPDQEEERGS